MRVVLLAMAAAVGCGLVTAAAPAADDVPGPATPLAGRRLRVAALPMATAVEWNTARPKGVAIEIWEAVAGRLGVTTDFVRVDTLVRLVDAIGPGGDADVALGPLAITEARERVIDLTHPIFHSGMRIAVRQRANTGFLAALESLLSWRLAELLATVVGLALASGHLLWWFERRVNPRSFPPAYPQGVWEAVWWITSTIVTGGCDDKHVDSPLGRVLAFAWMIGGIVLLAAFTSVLTATLTAERVTGTILGPRDLAGRSVACQEAAVSVQSVRHRGGIVQEFSTVNDALEALALGMVEAVVAENQQLMHLLSQRGRGDLRLVGPIFEYFDYGFGLRAGSELREPLNAAILTMREDGSLDRIMQDWLGRHD